MTTASGALRGGPRREIDLERFKRPHPGHYTMHDACCDYSVQRVIAKGKDPRRCWESFNRFFESVSPQQDAAKLTTGQVEDYVEARLAAGAAVGTVRRELTFVRAAISNAHRRNKIAQRPFIELPDGEYAERRPLTEDEYRLVMRQPMSARLRRFYVVAYFTGHRSGAIEELTWDRVDFQRGLINFNVPGRAINNKRRASDFPIPDGLMPRLRNWIERSTDAYVIGLGARGGVSSTYHESNHVVRVLAKLTDPTLVPRHCMRKMFATELFERGADPEVVGKMMADNPVTLRKHYVKFSAATLRAAVNLRSVQR
ncbi:MAG TPA: tyrosine-type recombinase/integrase [Usitatibacter sp.]|nr:tyrosine-type recombinase/integrase [Usitatibacter sp.]